MFVCQLVIDWARTGQIQERPFSVDIRCSKGRECQCAHYEAGIWARYFSISIWLNRSLELTWRMWISFSAHSDTVLSFSWFYKNPKSLVAGVHPRSLRIYDLRGPCNIIQACINSVQAYTQHQLLLYFFCRCVSASLRRIDKSCSRHCSGPTQRHAPRYASRCRKPDSYLIPSINDSFLHIFRIKYFCGTLATLRSHWQQ